MSYNKSEQKTSRGVSLSPYTKIHTGLSKLNGLLIKKEWKRAIPLCRVHKAKPFLISSLPFPLNLKTLRYYKIGFIRFRYKKVWCTLYDHKTTFLLYTQRLNDNSTKTELYSNSWRHSYRALLWEELLQRPFLLLAAVSCHALTAPSLVDIWNLRNVFTLESTNQRLTSSTKTTAHIWTQSK